MSQAITLQEALEILSDGEISSQGQLPWSSNYTFLVKVAPRGKSIPQDDNGEPLEIYAVYKPRRGETPLWDFPQGTLCLREYAAFLVSAQLGWNLVPPTVLRNGPQGFGSVQLYIDNDTEQHFFTFRENEALSEQLQQLVVFDLVTNNADRKSGHVLVDNNARLWAIDHGITFNVEHKLRTVIWDFANQPIPVTILDDLRSLQKATDASQPLGKALHELLDKDEIAAFKRRIKGLIELGHFPAPSRNARSIPWPPV
jgi:uncharacterized repeat protein (TIGR03843 family)